MYVRLGTYILNSFGCDEALKWKSLKNQLYIYGSCTFIPSRNIPTRDPFHIYISIQCLIILIVQKLFRIYTFSIQFLKKVK